MQVEYTSRIEEALEAGRAAAQRLSSFWLRYWCIPVYVVGGFAIGFSVSGLLPVLNIHLGRWPAVFVVLVLSLLPYGILIAVVRRLNTWLVGRHLESIRLERPFCFRLADSGLVWTTGATTIHVAFADIDRIMEGRSVIGFLIGYTATYLPKRAVGSDSDVTQFIRSVFDHLTEEAKKASLAESDVRRRIAEGNAA